MAKVLPIKIHISHPLVREHFWLSLLELLASLDLILISIIYYLLFYCLLCSQYSWISCRVEGTSECLRLEIMCFVFTFPYPSVQPQYFPGNIKWIWICLEGPNKNIWQISLKCVNLINIHIFSRFIGENQHYSCLYFKIIQLPYRSIFDFITSHFVCS